MMPYRIHEADLEVPENWLDQTINIFRLPAVASAKEASFVISRDSIDNAGAFADYVAGQLASAEQQLPGFSLLQKWDFELNGCPAALVDYTWEREGHSLMLRQVFVEHGAAVLITTLTTTVDDLPHHEMAWRKVMHSFTLRPASPDNA
ncbi:DcrB-related protein [Pseudomonas sp. GD03842]|uniref:DcrB-related protein n=1 Tax=Pseudomonas sp. GD03842 TaxID=2975385 RepID=UPI002447E359|nr:DcrB-related protein [Pseudomonas sp. GD03842]MDH0749410.1 DcrB-related protein [Pseudomonas sp. GD03842]